MDKIMIRGIRVACIIGVNGWERKTKQKVLIDVDLFGDWKKPARTDDIRHAVDYRDVTKNIVTFVARSKFHLVERLAEQIAGLCLESRGVRSATVRLFKPKALSDADTVGVEITRQAKSVAEKVRPGRGSPQAWRRAARHGKK